MRFLQFLRRQPDSETMRETSKTDTEDGGNVWTLKIIRTLSAVIIGPTNKKEAEKQGWDDAIDQGLIKEEEISDDQWTIEATLGAALSWREDGDQ